MTAEQVIRGVRVIYGQGMSSNVYLVEGGPRGTLAIDAGAYGVLEKEPNMLVLTHAHYDHTGGVGESWKNVYLHKREFRGGPFSKIPKNARGIDFERIEWGEFDFEVMHTPGHTMGSICLFDGERKLLFSGDTLFAEGIGRTDLGGDDAEMRKSIARLETLGWRILCPGHGRVVKLE